MTGVIRQDRPRRAPDQLKGRSTTRIAYCAVGVKSWARQPPSCGAVRPSRCPACGCLGAPVGGPLGLHGHGLRQRTQLGPLACGDPARFTELRLRRYVCVRCGAVTVVAPRGVLPRMRYYAVAIALALALWASEQWPGWRVHEAVSPHAGVGNERLHGWRSLSRWARSSRCLWPFVRAPPDDDTRAAALHASRSLAARAPVPSGRIRIDACAGAGIC